ncbi:hypothetical protein RvY_03913-2, partial [Ramazzottius varieornatus]
MGRVPLCKRDVNRALSCLSPKRKLASASNEVCSATSKSTTAPPLSREPHQTVSPSTAPKDKTITENFTVRLGELVSNFHLTVSIKPCGPTLCEADTRTAQSLRQKSVIRFAPKSYQSCSSPDEIPRIDHGSFVGSVNFRFDTSLWLAREGRLDLRIETTITSMMHLMTEVHENDRNTSVAPLHHCILHDLIACQPKGSLQDCIDNIVHRASTVVQKYCRWAHGLPGYALFSTADQQAIVFENCMSSWLITHQRYFRNPRGHCLIGPLQTHQCVYWIHHPLDPTYLRALSTCTAVLNRLHLSRLEAFFLLAITMFTPGSVKVANKAHMSFLHSHYSDCLRYLLRSDRQGIFQASLQFEEQVLEAVDVIRNFDETTRDYVRTLNLTKTSARPGEESLPVRGS